MLTSYIIPKEINDNPTWKNAVTRASEWTAETLGRWEADKHFSWRIREEPDRGAVFDLRIEADGCAVSDRFDEFEINNEKLFKARVVRMWGNLTQQTIHVQAERLKHMSEEWRRQAPVGAD
jgi:hypothetical protein